jgi:hypothetical protein
MIKLKNLIYENSVVGKTLISVDIQPAYENAFGFRIEEYTDFLNVNYDSLSQLVFLYNGPDLGFPDESEYKYWLLENGLNEEIVDQSKFFDKGYAFFRLCIDNGLDEDIISSFVRFMYMNDINDSRDMSRDMWAKYLKENRNVNRSEVMELYKLIKDNDDMVNIPDLMEYIKRFNNIVLTGGGINECLKEVEIALKALNKPYSVYNEFIY